MLPENVLLKQQLRRTKILKESIREEEQARKKPPTKSQINEVKKLLKDFNIPIKDFPVFDTYKDMLDYKNQKIRES